MKTSEKANYIDNMPYEIFSELISNSSKAKTSYNRTKEIIKIVSNEKIADNRGNAHRVLNNDMLLSCIRSNESLLTAKMVSLNIIFANPSSNPNYFDELCEVFSSKNNRTGEEVIDYAKIAQTYNTTIDNVKSNILFSKTISQLAQQKNSKTK